jgi:hypothetical protein
MANYETAAFTKPEDSSNDDEVSDEYLSNEELRSIDEFKKGSQVSVVKKEIKEGESSSLPAGWSDSGKLARDIEVGRPILFDDGTHTSKVFKVRQTDDGLLVETNTSIYKVEAAEEKFLTNKDLRKMEGYDRGDKVELEKVSIKEGKSSNVPVGNKLSGNLRRNIKIGDSVKVNSGGKTSKVESAKMQDGKLLIETNTSIYEVRRIDFGAEKIRPEDVVSKITENPDKFDEKVVTAAERYGDSFELAKRIDGNLFVFSESRDNKAIALVRDESGEWHARAFHHSGSDKQWKAVPAANPARQLKGDESEPNNHYVQSNKLAKEVHQSIDQTTHKDGGTFDIRKLIPMAVGANSLEYSEKNIHLNNPDWHQVRKELKQEYDFYMALSDNGLEGLAPNQPFGQFCQQAENNYDVDPELKQLYDRMVNHFGEDRLERMALAKFEYSSGDKQKMYNLFVESLHKVMRQKREEIGNKLEAADMLPSFNAANLHDSYSKNSGEDEIQIHEFVAQSPEGDEIVWSMANDASGRTYIDNIYPKNASTDSYGALDPKCNMGILVYKPADYRKQTLAIPEEDVDKKVGRYNDISSCWEKFTPVKRYKEFLRKQKG